jgi:phenylalanyl-tRNA synthetase beta chain
MPFTLTNEVVHFQRMRRKPGGATRVMHPISELHTILRTSLLSSLLEILSLNQHHPLPQRIFAVGEVVEDRKTGMNLAAASIHSKASFSEIRSVADACLREMAVAAEMMPSMDGAFWPGRGADMFSDGTRVGCFGEVHPEVVRGFGLEQPVVAMEMKWGEL